MSTVKSFPLWSGGRGHQRAEVILLAQMDIGQGDAMVSATRQLQSGHASFLDALDEPSAKVMSSGEDGSEETALYTFIVDENGHPFHAHAGHRVFTAVSGSAGTSIRFSFALSDEMNDDPSAFIQHASRIELPPDCLFSVRFGRGVWHQFLPGAPGHPALFAISCHTEEVHEIKRVGISNDDASIEALTQVLPLRAQAFASKAAAWESVSISYLSLSAPPISLASKLCAVVRHHAGKIRRLVSRSKKAFVLHQIPGSPMKPCPESLAVKGLSKPSHIDAYAIEMEGQYNASVLMHQILDGFIKAPPIQSTRLMKIRNVFAKPLRLRQSPLCCPVSSLISGDQENQFQGFPVLASRCDSHSCRVLLGADDWHLSFRTEVEIKNTPRGAQVKMTTAVQTKGWFGSVYLWLIAPVHRKKITPEILLSAINHAKLAPVLC